MTQRSTKITTIGMALILCLNCSLFAEKKEYPKVTEKTVMEEGIM